MTKVRYVDTTFGTGKPVRMMLHQDRFGFGFDIKNFEQNHGALFSLLQRLAVGSWPVSAIQPLLLLAYKSVEPNPLAAEPHVTRVLERTPPGVYVPLCAKLIEAHLYGLHPEESTWDEAAAIEANNRPVESQTEDVP